MPALTRQTALALPDIRGPSRSIGNGKTYGRGSPATFEKGCWPTLVSKSTESRSEGRVLWEVSDLEYHAKGRTALLDAIVLAMHEMKNSTRSRKALLIISDGGDNYSVTRRD